MQPLKNIAHSSVHPCTTANNLEQNIPKKWQRIDAWSRDKASGHIVN